MAVPNFKKSKCIEISKFLALEIPQRFFFIGYRRLKFNKSIKNAGDGQKEKALMTKYKSNAKIG